ncbi:hypothetical protein QYM36_006169 [Artemia franciscana]|uniref:Monocarboxylate transporter n=1 Tax=Artemia franciscana TaxID=6661 RepID=A0AA88HST5_ARTSF|nr:hypothetical protein QYM36_006169 [Artemia franciscana]
MLYLLINPPITSAMCLRFSCRSVVFAGGLCSCLGLTLSFFATSLEHLCLTIGVLVGIGAGLATTPGILMTSRYFEKRRALANGICISGTAVGGMVLPALVEFLTSRYTFRGSILILGACMLHVCVAALLFRPIEVYQRILEGDPKMSVLNAEDTGNIDAEKEEITRESVDAITKSGRFSISLHTEDFIVSNDTKLSEGLPDPNFFDDSDEEENRSIVHDTITPLVKSRLMKNMRNDSNPVLARGNFPGYSPVVGLTRHPSLHREGRTFFGRLGSLKNVASLRNINESSLPAATPPPITPLPNRRHVSWLQSTNSLMHSVVDLNVDSTCTFKDEIKSPSTQKEKKGLRHYMKFSLLKNYLFLLLTSTVMLMAVGCPHLLLYLPAHVTGSIGMTKTESGVLLSITAACDLVGRLLGGWLADMQFISRSRMYSCSMLLAAVTAIFLPLAETMVGLGILSGIFGFSVGSWFLMVPILLTDYHGVDVIPASYGLVRLFQGGVTLGIPPLIGLIRDLTGSYNLGFYIMGGCMSCAAIIMIVCEPFALRFEERKKNAIITVKTQEP